MVIAASLSIWVANVAVTVMLIPIVDSVFQELTISVFIIIDLLIFIFSKII